MVATTVMSRAVAVARTVLRGRSQAMATALSMMRRVRAHGRGGVLVLEGEPEPASRRCSRRSSSRQLRRSS